MGCEDDWETSCNYYTRNDTQRLAKGTGRVGNRRTSRNRLNYSIFKIGQNTEKNTGELRRLSVTQTPVKDHQLSAKVNVKNYQVIIIIIIIGMIWWER